MRLNPKKTRIFIDMKTSLLSIAVFAWLLACQGNRPDQPEAMTSPDAPSRSMEQTDAKTADAGTGESALTPKVIRHGSVGFTVPNASAARETVDGIIARRGAAVHQEYLANTDYESRYTLQLRVPAGSLDSLVEDLEAALGAPDHKSIQAQDVTEQYIDLETRMANKRAYLEQYRQLLTQARTMEDMLKVREQIRILEEEIESVTGRLRYLSDQVALSTLELTLVEQKAYTYRPRASISFFERLKESVSGGWYGFVQFSLFVFRLWPFIILLALVIMWWRRRRTRRRTPPPTSV